MKVLSVSSFVNPVFFYINIEVKIHGDIPIELLEGMFREQFKILQNRLRIRLHVFQMSKNTSKLICSSDEGMDQERELIVKNLMLEISQRVFSIFEPEVETPIEIQWEYI